MVPKRSTTRRLVGFETLERRLPLAADLQVTDIYLRDYLGNRVESAPIGEWIEVVAKWRTSDLPADARYDIKFQVNSYELTIPSIAQGAGVASFLASYTQAGWYALQGQNTIAVTIDSSNKVLETSEANNQLQRVFTASIPNPPTKFAWPLAGKLFEDFGISNENDVDPSSNSVDQFGRTIYANGHIGWDIAPGPFSANDNGLEVLATADGIVTWASDGIFDREIETGKFATNGFGIDHGNGFASLYVHLRRDSITVKPGDSVKAGQRLGLVGSSGNSSGPHLHFEVTRNGRGVNLMIGREFYLTPDIEDRFQRAGMTYLSVSNRPVIGADYLESISSSRVFLANEVNRAILWFTVMGWKRPGPLTIETRRPDGSLLWKYDFPMNYDAGFTTIGNWWVDLPANAMPGKWKINYSYAGVPIGEDFFELANVGLGELVIRKDNVMVAESRWTPYEFPSVAIGSPAPKLRFSIENHGKADLSIQGLEVPNWVTVVTAPPAVLKPNETSYFEIAANTSLAGTRWAQVALLSSDASEKRSTFQVQSTVTSTRTNSTRVGLFTQYGTEGQSILGKVYRSIADNQPLLVDLSTSGVADVAIPATVTIPANVEWVSFPIMLIDDSTVEPLERVDIIAKPRRDYLDSISELLLIDNDQVTQDLSMVFPSDSVSEKGGKIKGTLTRTGDIRDSLVVNLFLNNTAKARAPLFVTIPAFRSSVDFVLNGIDDDLVLGNQDVEIVASVFGKAASKKIIKVLDDEIAKLTLSIDSVSILENGGSTNGTVTRNTPNNAPLVVNLSSSNVLAATVPNTVVIPVGADSATFVIRGVDDTIADGTQRTTVTAFAFGFQAGTASLDVLDDEVATLSVSLPDSVQENLGSTTATVSRNTPTNVPLTVNLASSLPDAASVPNSLTIPVGQTSSTFTVTLIDDTIANGNRQATVSASATNFVTGAATVAIVDNESPSLSLTASKDSISESDGTSIITVTRNTPTTQSLVVGLRSSDTRVVTVPNSVTIPAGANSITFLATATNDSLANGDQQATVTASATGFSNGTVSLMVVDDEVPTLAVSLLPASVSEKNGKSRATVTRNTPTNSSMIVNLSSNNLSAATVPSSVVIPVGASFVTFDVTAVDDPIADGTQVADIVATASDFVPGSAQLTVTDDDVPRLALNTTLSSISEKDGTTTLVVTRNTSVASEISIDIESSDPLSAAVPKTVTIPKGAEAIAFSVTAIDDNIADGNQRVTITAAAMGMFSGTLDVDVIDDELASLALSVDKSSMAERDGKATATVTRNTPMTNALDVFIASEDASKLQVPVKVTIPVGQASVSFDVSSIDNTTVDGDRELSLSASSLGFATGQGTIVILDDDVPTLNIVFSNASISEKYGTTTGIVSRNTSTTSTLTVDLMNSRRSLADIPATVVIPQGAVSISFTVQAINDAVADGDDSLELSAAASGFQPSSGTLNIIDDDVPGLFIELAAASVSEPRGTTTAKVKRNTQTNYPIIVSLASSDTGEAVVPISVEISAGASEASFTITAMADNVVDGPQKARITASFLGFVDGLAEITVDDIDFWTWTNPRNPLDTDDDNSLSPLDVLGLINDLNTNGSRRLTLPNLKPQVFLDPDGDSIISPLDVLVIINYLNRAAGGEGENVAARFGESAPSLMLGVVDHYFSGLDLDDFQRVRLKRSKNS